MIEETPGRRLAAVIVLAATYLITLPQRVLIPRWYEASLHIADVLLLLDCVATVVAVVWTVRRRSWPRLARAGVILGLGLVLVGAGLVSWSAEMREGVFVCGRELRLTMDCPAGGQAFEFDAVCVAGNPKVEVEVRPGVLPFMYPVAAKGAAEACGALKR
jgi:hypothetical protein